MNYIILFPFADYWWFYGGFTLFILGLLALDLGVFHRHAHAVTVKEAFAWTLVWVSLALLFCGRSLGLCSGGIISSLSVMRIGLSACS